MGNRSHEGQAAIFDFIAHRHLLDRGLQQRGKPFFGFLKRVAGASRPVFKLVAADFMLTGKSTDKMALDNDRLDYLALQGKQQYKAMPRIFNNIDKGLLPVGRACMYMEIVGLAAYLHGLTGKKFARLSATFTPPGEPVKMAAHNVWRDVERSLLT